jgi:hypothetical protein
VVDVRDDGDVSKVGADGHGRTLRPVTPPGTSM